MSARIDRGVSRGRRVTMLIDGREVAAFEGETVATAMLAADLAGFRRDGAGAPHGLFCNMGTCSECFVGVRIDAAPRRRLRACLTPVAAGMAIDTGGATNG